MKAPFRALDCSEEAQRFLYACAFWTVAADEQLKPGEQSWLIEQFGEDGATQSLNEFIAIDSKEFFEVFEGSVNALADADRQSIYPDLEAWLVSCAQSDGEVPASELEIIEKIKERTGIANQGEQTQEPRTASVEAEERLFEGHSEEVMAVSVSSDGRFYLSGSEDRLVKIWDSGNGTVVRTFEEHEMGVTGVKFCSGTSLIVSGDRMGVLKVWDGESLATVWEHYRRGSGGITDIDVRKDGKIIALSSDVGLLTLLDVEKRSDITTFGEKSRGTLHSVCFSNKGDHILSGGDDRTMRLWDAKTGSEVKVFEGHSDGVTAVAFCGNDKFALSGSRDNTLKLWDVVSGSEIRTFKGHSFSVYDVSVSEDGKYAVSASWDHTVKLWNVETGQEVFNMESLSSRFSSAVFIPGGRGVVAGSSDKAVHVITLK